MDKDPFNQIIKKWPPEDVFVDLFEKYLVMNAGLWSSVCVWSWIFENVFEIFWIVYKITDEWYIQWQRVTTSGTTSDNKWQRMAMNDNEWQRVVQRVTTSDNEWQYDNELQRIATSDTTIDTTSETTMDNEWYNEW